MLSVGKLTLGQEAYYEQQVVRGLDDYYAGRGESPGIWAGRGAAELELSGVVEDGELGTLLRGVDPATEKQLRKPVRERTITVRELDLETGRWVEGWKALKPVSGYDLVFSCPKSVSLLHALTDDERVRREISEAHEASWQAALRYLEREACVVRRGKGGKHREHGQGFVAAAFRHRTSRAQDPHLHTHVVVANMARAEDGTWLALDGEAILKTYRLAAGYLYEANLRQELTRRLGLTWTEPVKGMGELERVSEEAIRAFSSRRQSLVEHMDAMGSEGFAASRVAALATRERKEQVDLPRLREEWKARAAEHGLGRRELKRLGHERPRLDVSAIDRDSLAERLFGPEGLTAKQTTFALPELVCAVAGSLREGATVERVLAEAEALAQLPALERLEQDDAPGRPARFTTRELLALERDALELALAGKDVDAPRPDGTTLARLIMESGRELTGDQRMLLHEAAWRPGRFLCIAGAAGSGKTTALRVLADAYRESETPLLGAAPSGRAADELECATGVPSSTFHRLLLDAHREGGLPRGCVLLVDETSMAETRVLAPVLELVEQAEGRAILVGDPHQLPSVGAGGLFATLCERLGAIDLAGNRRQRDLSERRALALLRQGDPYPYLAHAARSGRLHLEQDPSQATQRLVEDWWQVAQHDLAGSVMLAYRRCDVRELNEAARAVLARAGRLGPDALEAGGREFRVGDRVLCRRNDRSLGVRNGTRGTVVNLGPWTLTLRMDAGQLRSLPLPYAAADLDHAYALTGHAAQGATVERAFVLLPDEGALREWGYVACSRARAETHLYLAQRDTLERETPLREPSPTGPPERAARALKRSSTEPLALDRTRLRRDATLRVLAKQQEHLDQLRGRTTERLATAQLEHKRLHWWNRGSRRFELEVEIARYMAVLERSDERRNQLIEHVERRSRFLALARERESRSPLLGLEPRRPGLEHAPSGRTIEL
ncbi:MAG TPA: MobF family relaxase [Gaiellaceae bacterium]|nr:MobF family relaxase [Gaiellaceae bacterium]